MLRTLALLAASCVLFAAGWRGLSAATDRHNDASEWTLAWSDEFSGPDGSAPDSSKWTYDIGGTGWGNQELETYTSRRQNAQIRDGNLVIAAFEENFTGPDGVARNFTSARLKTQYRFAHAYGRFEARIRLPKGPGMWPAFWLLGDDIDRVGWPDCGEIDIMENVGKEPGINHGSLHAPAFARLTSDTTKTTLLPNGSSLADDFHLYAAEWEPGLVRLYLDDRNYATFSEADWPAGGEWVFDHPFFIILNLAVGGFWPGSPDATTQFPQEMLVDYVRVYTRK